MAQLGLSLVNVQAQESYSPLPAGEYPVKVTDTEVKNSKAGNVMLNVTFTVEDGHQFSGRKVFDNFVVSNEVAMKRLKSMAVAGKHPHPDFIQDSEELHGLRLVIRVKIEDGGDGYGPKNKISAFKAGESSTPLPPTNTIPAPAPATAAAPATASAPAAAPAAGGKQDKLPWE